MNRRHFFSALIACFALIGSVLPAFSFPIMENPIYPLIRKEIEKQASSALGREVRVGSVSGNLITSVVLEDVAVAKDKKISQGKMLSIKRAKISYNALRGVLAKDILQALTRIHLDEPDVYVEHEKDGSWSFEKLIPQGEPGGSPPPVFRARISISKGRALFVDKKGFGAPLKEEFDLVMDRIDGTVNFSKKNSLLFRVSASSKASTFKVDGSVDLPSSKTDLKVVASDLDLKKWNSYLGIPFAKDIQMSGPADLTLFVSTLPELKLKASVNVKNGSLYERPFKGDVLLSLEQRKFSLSISKAVLCSGNVSGSFTADLSGERSGLSGKFGLSGTDMAVLSAGIPGISGRAEGIVSIKGKGSDIGISGKVKFSEGRLFGQAVEVLSTAVSIKDGDISVDSMKISSGQKEFSAKGYAKKDKSFDLRASIRGFSFSNPDLFGGIYGVIDSFDGRISGKLDEDTFKHPFKNIEADGVLLLSSGRIGSQKIGRAQGRIVLSRGILFSEGFSVVLESGGFLLSGSIGINKKSDFTVIGKNLDLADLKIIDDILPEGAKGVSGNGDLVITVGGYLSESQNIAEAVKTLDISVEANVFGASVGLKDIRSARLLAQWEDGALHLRTFYVETPGSRFNAYGEMADDGRLSGSCEGNVVLSEFAPFIQRYAKVLGRVSFNADLSGTWDNPDVSVDFVADDVNYNNIRFDRLSGTLGYKDRTFYLADPAVLNYGNDKYSVYGKLSFDKFGALYSGGAYTDKGDLSSLFSMARMAYEEFGKREDISDKKISGRLIFPKVDKYRSPEGEYSLLNINNGFLKQWEQAIRPVSSEAEARDTTEYVLGMKAEAPLGLRAEFFGDRRGITASASFISSRGKISSYSFDSISGTVILKNSALVLEGLTVKKSSGNIFVSGSVDFAGPVDISVKAKDFNIKGMDRALNFGIPVEGVIDLNASVSGTYRDPKVDCIFAGSQAGFGDIYLDRIGADLKYQKGQLFIDKLDINAGNQSASMEGVIPFVKGKEISLALDLNGDNVGLLASLVKGVKWDSGKGYARLKASGTLERPKIIGVLSLKNAVVDIDHLKTTLYNFSSDILFEGSKVSVKQFSGVLSGDRTLGRPLPFSLAGHLDFSETFTSKKKTDVNLAVADTSGHIDIPGIYSGGFSLSGCRLKGPLIFPGGKGENGNMLIRASVSLKDGAIFLPKAGDKDAPKPNIEFDVSAAIGKNMRLMQGSGGQTLSMDLANINLEIFGEELLLSGTMASPVVNGEVEIKSGSLSILSREFDILSEYDQERYFGSDRSSVIKNEAVFQGGEKPYSAIPYIRLTAKSEIVSYTKTVAGNPSDSSAPSPTVQKDTTVIITRIFGMPFVQDKARMIEPSFYAFKLDATKSPPEPVEASYDQNQIRLMLLPDFLKSSLGVSKDGGQEGIDANAIIVDYLNARLQSYLLRGVTSRVEDALGLESFTLDYNFGRDLEKLLPTKRGEYAVNDTPQFGVGFVKGIFDNVFIQVRYAQALEQASYASNLSLNYQITWKATRYYSLVYYREPVTFQDLDSTYYKMTVQSQYSF